MSEGRIDIAAVRRKLAGLSGRQYWQGLEALAETDEFQEYLHREFPRQASVWDESLSQGGGSHGMSRRSFFKLLGASLALAGLAGCVNVPARKIVPYVKSPDPNQVPGKSLFYTTAMIHAGYAMGLLVESNEGRPTKIEGNPDHPASLGSTDTFAQAEILEPLRPGPLLGRPSQRTDRHLRGLRQWIRQRVGRRERERWSGHPHPDGGHLFAHLDCADGVHSEGPAQRGVAAVGGGVERPGRPGRADGLRSRREHRLSLRPGRHDPQPGLRFSPEPCGHAAILPRLHQPAAGQERHRRLHESPVRGRRHAHADGREGGSQAAGALAGGADRRPSGGSAYRGAGHTGHRELAARRHAAVCGRPGAGSAGPCRGEHRHRRQPPGARRPRAGARHERRAGKRGQNRALHRAGRRSPRRPDREPQRARQRNAGRRGAVPAHPGREPGLHRTGRPGLCCGS